MTRREAEKYRRHINTVVDELTDEAALDVADLFLPWQVDTDYAAGDRRKYDDKLYRCEQAHTSQAEWTPDKTPALWTEVAKPGEIPVWKQPTGAQDAYQKGDKVHYPDKDGPVYVSIIDNNTWSPIVYGWEEET